MDKKSIFSALFGLSIAAPSYAQQIPTGVAVSLTDILSISENIGGFLMIAGSLLAGIAVIWAGIVYMTSGSDATRVKGAKDMLKVALIGALIIFGVGVIVNTVKLLASNPLKFFQ